LIVPTLCVVTPLLTLRVLVSTQSVAGCITTRSVGTINALLPPGVGVDLSTIWRAAAVKPENPVYLPRPIVGKPTPTAFGQNQKLRGQALLQQGTVVIATMCFLRGTCRSG
jgi:hypothetical protein